MAYIVISDSPICTPQTREAVATTDTATATINTSNGHDEHETVEIIIEFVDRKRRWRPTLPEIATAVGRHAHCFVVCLL